MLSVLDAANSLVQNTANNSEQQDLDWAKQDAAEKAFGRKPSVAEKSALAGLPSLLEANQWIEQQGFNWAKQDAAEKAFGRGLSEAEKAKVVSLESVQQVNDWAAQKGREWLSSTYGPQAFYSQQNFIKNSGLNQDTAQKVWFSTDTYIDPVENKDYTDGLRNYLAKQLTDRGITNFGQLEKKVIPGVADKLEGDPEFGQYFVPGTPDVTKYYNKTTGKEIDPVLFDDKAGTKYIVTSNGIQKQLDPTTRLAAQLRSYVDPSSTGGAWGTKAGKRSPPGFGPEGMMRQIAQRVQNNTGVSDINQLGFRNAPVVKQVKYDDVGRPYYEETAYDEYGNYAGVTSRLLTDDEKNKVKNGTIQLDIVAPEIYNKQTGQKIRDGSYIDLGGWGEGPGITYASMTFDANGKPKISTYGEDTNTLSQIQPLMTIASIIPSPIQPFAIAANAANAAYNYGNFAPAIMATVGASGILDSIAGTASNVAGPAGELASNSGIAGLAQNLGVSANLANSIGKVGAQTLLGGTLSAAQGKGFLPGAKTGAISGGISAGVNELGNVTGLNKGLGSLSVPARSLATSALVAKALNRPFDLGQAVQNAAINYGLSQAGQAAGFTPSQQKTLSNFLNFAAPMIAARRRP